MTLKNSRLDQPESVRKLLYLLAAICALLFMADFVVHRHVVHPWEALTGFFAVFGFVACVVLVLLAREMRKVVMRREDYYEGADD